MSAVETINTLMWLLAGAGFLVINWHLQLSAQQARDYLKRWKEDSAQAKALLDAAIDAHDAKGYEEALGRYRVITQAYVAWFESRR